MYEEDFVEPTFSSEDEMKKAIGEYILEGYDIEMDDYDEYGCPNMIHFYRLKDGYFEQKIDINVKEEYADYFGFDKIDHRVEYDYRYSYTEGRILKNN